MNAPVSPDRVIAAVQLQDVRLRAGRFSRRVTSPAEAGRVLVEISHEAHAEPIEGKSAFLVTFCGGAALRPAAAKTEEPALEAHVEIELRYGYPERTEFRKDELEAFASLNGVFNAWPYFREYLQSVTTRMGLPPFVLPVFRVKRSPRPSSEGEKPRPRRRTVKG